MAFNQSLYDEFDFLSWQCVKKNLLLFDIEEYHEVENYDIDTKISLGGITFQLELEVSRIWQNENFPYNRISLLHRKVIKYKNYQNAYYLIFNKSLSHVAIVKFLDAFDLENLKERFVKSRGEFDLFFMHPLHKTTIIPTSEIEYYFLNIMNNK